MVSPPSTPVSAGMRPGGRELTASEQSAFARSRRVAALRVSVGFVSLACGLAFVASAAKEVRPVERTFEQGSLIVTAEFVGSRKHGRYVERYGNGKIKTEGRYDADKAAGVWTTHYWNGQVQARGERRGTVKHGPWEYLSPEGNLRKVESYDDGVAHGHWAKWHDNGQLAADQHFVHGRSDGIAREWHDNGQLASEQRFVDGVPEGPYRSFHADGSDDVTGMFRAGERVGVWTEREPAPPPAPANEPSTKPLGTVKL